MEENKARPETAVALERWRQSAGLSRQRLADLADVSATYVRTIEVGTDDLGREVVPSAVIMQKLAHGLAQALAAENEARREALEREAYAELMAAAGYLPGPGPRSEVSPDEASPAPAVHKYVSPQSSILREAGPNRYGGPVHSYPPVTSDLTPVHTAVTLRDPRLREHARDLLQNWESLDPDDQTLLLGIMAWIHERRQRQHNMNSGGL